MFTILVVLIVLMILWKLLRGIAPILFLVWLGVVTTDKISIWLTGELPAYRQDHQE